MTDSLTQAALRLRQTIDRFVPLTDEEWAGIVPHLTLVAYKKHDTFVQKDVVAKEVGLVLEGVFRQFYTKESEERTTYFFFENQLVGAYMSCVTGCPSPVAIEALTEATCVRFPYRILRDLFDRYPNWQKFGRLLAEYVMVSLEERMAGLLMLSPEERYLALLQGDNQEIFQNIPQHYIANYLGITPVSLSRIRKRIVKK